MKETELEWTGERLLTSVETINKAEHLHRYAFACDFIEGKIVLDIASGEGYGSNLLGKLAKSVVGVDISSDAVNHANKKYGSDKLKFILGSAFDIPLVDHSIDVVISFETLEHHDQHEKMLSEIKRVLTKDGILIISTPDKLNYSDRRNYNNPYHVKELYVGDFKQLLSNYFINAKLLFQNEFYGTYLLNEENVNLTTRSFNGDYDSINVTKPTESSEYLIAIASNNDIPPLFDSLFINKNYWDDEINFLNFRIQEKQKVIDAILKSKPYRVGYFLLSPFIKLMNLFGK